MADGARFSSTTKSACPYCGVGCGVIVNQEGGERDITVRGDPDHPANLGRLCSKGLALGETLSVDERLLYPLKDGKRISWPSATSHIAKTFSDVIKQHGPDAVAFYVSGQLLTEDYYVANKLMKGFIGSGNIDTNSRLCMASSVAGHKRAFGADTVPGCYEDLDLADLVILTGSNFAWCHPVLYQRLLAAKSARPKMRIVVIDPRRTATCDLADLHLPLRPGSDIALFLGLMNSLEQAGKRDKDFVINHTNGAEEALTVASQYDLKTTSNATGIAQETLSTFFDWVITTPKTVTVYSQGVNQASDGTDRVNAIINCHLLTGRIGKPGSGPFSITGQPNAMGGREVGGLANQLASHLSFENTEDRDLVSRFWGTQNLTAGPGYKAVDLFEKIHDGAIKAVWIMATNPVVSMPNANFVREALRKCELVVVSDVMANTDTGACADILLPSLAWGEKQGMVTNSERRMSRQRQFLQAPGEARADWRQFCDVAIEMGYSQAFTYNSVYEVFREYTALCSFENNGARDLDLSGLKDISKGEYNDFAPQQWPVLTEEASPSPHHRFFSDGGFFTPNKRANFIATKWSDDQQANSDYPFTLNTGRIRDQWHTMTRTGLAPRLFQHISEPFVEISPVDAKDLNIQDAQIVRLRSPYGEALGRAVVTDRQAMGSIFSPMHWTEQYAAQSRIDVLVAPKVDPISGQPALKSTKVAVENFKAKWYGFVAIAAEEFDAPHVITSLDYWAKGRFAFSGAAQNEYAKGVRIEMASERPINNRQFVDALFQDISNAAIGGVEVIDFTVGEAGKASYAAFIGDQLMALFYCNNAPVTASRSWACEQIGQEFSGLTRTALLAGRPGADVPDRGATICSCMNVGANEIRDAIGEGCSCLDTIADKTKAGSNCGSCRSEIIRLLKEKAHA